MQHSQKTGATHRPSDVWAFRLANPFSFKHLRTHSREQAKRISFFSITCTLFSLRRRGMFRGAPPSFQRVDVPTSDLSSVLTSLLRQSPHPSHCGQTPLVPQLAKSREFFTIRGNNSALPGV